MINRKYWRHYFLEAINKNNQFFIKYLLEKNCQIDSDIFTSILRIPNLEPEILDLAIQAAYNFKSHQLQQVIDLFPKNEKAVLASIEITKNIEGHLLEALSKLDYIDISIGQNILRKLVSYDQSRLTQVLNFARDDQDLINLAIQKMETLLPHNLQQIFAIPNITSKNLALAIVKAEEIAEWNLRDLLDLKPSNAIIYKAISKTKELFGWDLQKLLNQGYDNPTILKLCVSKINKLDAWHLKEVLQVENLDGPLIRLVLNKLDFIDDIALIKSTLNKTDFIRAHHIQLLLKSGIFQDVRELAIEKFLNSSPSNNQVENITNMINMYTTSSSSDSSEYHSPESFITPHPESVLSGEEE